MAKKAAASAAATAAAVAQQATKLNQYEAMFLFGAGFAADVDKAIGLARGIIEKHAGQVLVAKKWDERKLAYEITGNKRGAVHHHLLQRARRGGRFDRARREPLRRRPSRAGDRRVAPQQGRDGKGRAAADHPRRAAELGTRRI